MTSNEIKRTIQSIILVLIISHTAFANATIEGNYKNSIDLLPQIFESTQTENGYTTVIILNPTVIGVYTAENGYNLGLAINPEGIGGSLNEGNYKINLIPTKSFPDLTDIAVISLSFSKTVVGEGFPISIVAVIVNNGLYSETFIITAYANTTLIKTQTTTVAHGNLVALTFTLDTTGFAKGNYTISAVAETLPGEINPADNTYVGGWVVVTMQGDVNGDFRCEGTDLAYVAKAYDTYPGDLRWNPDADVNGDDKVEGIDVAIVAKNYDKSDP